MFVRVAAIVVAAVPLVAVLSTFAFSEPMSPLSASAHQEKTLTAEELTSLRQKADAGDGDAQHALGTLHLVGQGVPMDRAEALKWFGLEAARAEGSRRTELGSAFDSIANAVHPREIGEAFWRASVWARDYNRRSRPNMANLMSVFGATYPRLQREVKPRYSKAAKEKRIEGTVVLDCVVNVYGTVGECQVTRSLDSVYGLDQEAVKAAEQWRFRPGTVRDRPVPSFVIIELSFKLV